MRRIWRCFSYSVSWAVETKTTYLASAVDRATLVCFLLLHLTSPRMHTSRCGLSVITSPIFRKSHTVAILLGFEDKSMTCCVFQVSQDPLHDDPATSDGFAKYFAILLTVCTIMSDHIAIWKLTPPILLCQCTFVTAAIQCDTATFRMYGECSAVYFNDHMLDLGTEGTN